MEPFQPFFELNRIQNEINRLFEQLSDVEPGRAATGGWTPNVDIHEAGNDLEVKFELPGVDPGSVKLSVNGSSLILEGDKTRTEPKPGTKYDFLERRSGKFRKAEPMTVLINTQRAVTRYRR